MLNEKDNSFDSWIDKKRYNKNGWVFSKTKTLEANVKIGLYLSDYTTNVDLKNVTGVDTLYFAKETDRLT